MLRRPSRMRRSIPLAVALTILASALIAFAWMSL